MVHGRRGMEKIMQLNGMVEVTDLDCQSDVDAMKEWEIGTEHVVRINGKR